MTQVLVLKLNASPSIQVDLTCTDSGSPDFVELDLPNGTQMSPMAT